MSRASDRGARFRFLGRQYAHCAVDRPRLAPRRETALGQVDGLGAIYPRPLMIIPPKSQAGPVRIGRLTLREPWSVCSISIPLCDFCNVPGPEELDGQSLVPLLHDPKLDTDRYVLTTFDKGNVALRNERYRYIRYADGCGRALRPRRRRARKVQSG